MKPFLSEKQKTHNITLIEKYIILSKEKEVAETLNIFFTRAVYDLDITEPKMTNINKNKCNDIININDNNFGIEKK